jgi:hypothetical protein
MVDKKLVRVIGIGAVAIPLIAGAARLVRGRMITRITKDMNN